MAVSLVVDTQDTLSPQTLHGPRKRGADRVRSKAASPTAVTCSPNVPEFPKHEIRNENFYPSQAVSVFVILLLLPRFLQA